MSRDDQIKKELVKKLKENEKRKHEKELEELDLEVCRISYLFNSFIEYEAKFQKKNSKFSK